MANIATIPSLQYTFSSFEIQRYVSQSESNSGLINIYEYSDPRWKITLTTRPLVYSDGQMFDAWFQSLKGGIRPVLIRSPHYCQPRAHIGAKGPEKKAGTLVSVQNKTKASVSGTDLSLKLSPGDYVSFESNGFYALAMVIAASRSGANMIIDVEPPIPSYIANGATVYFDRAQILARPLWGEYQKWSWNSKTVTCKFMECWK